jgi:hypothetical protein
MPYSLIDTYHSFEAVSTSTFRFCPEEGRNIFLANVYKISTRLYSCNIQTSRTVTVSTVSGEGPRSRRYGRTAALRLLVQTYDENEDDDYYFYLFPSNGTPVE